MLLNLCLIAYHVALYHIRVKGFLMIYAKPTGGGEYMITFRGVT